MFLVCRLLIWHAEAVLRRRLLARPPVVPGSPDLRESSSPFAEAQGMSQPHTQVIDMASQYPFCVVGPASVDVRFIQSLDFQTVSSLVMMKHH